MAADILLNLSHVRKGFGGILAVSDLNLQVRNGEILGLIGPNGAGKSTLFKLISGFERPDAGKLVFDHHDISNLPPHRICNRGIATNFQQPLPIRNLSVFDLLMVATHNRAGNAQSLPNQVKATSKRFKLDHLLNSRVGELDYASLRLLDFARAVATGCTLLLLDEPFAGQDTVDSDFLASTMDSLHREGLTIILADHIIARLESLCDRLAFMDAGRLIKIGTPNELMTDKQVKESYFGIP